MATHFKLSVFGSFLPSLRPTFLCTCRVIVTVHSGNETLELLREPSGPRFPDNCVKHSNSSTKVVADVRLPHQIVLHSPFPWGNQRPRNLVAQTVQPHPIARADH